MNYTYTRDWCNIVDTSLTFESTLDPIEREIILEAYKRLMEDLTDARLSYDLFSSYIDQDTLFEQMYQVALGHPETLLDRAHYAYGLCDPCRQPTNYIRWSLANRECEQAYKLQPICGEYGESIFSLSEYTSENVA